MSELARKISTKPQKDDGRPLPPLADPVNAEIFRSVESAGLAMHELLNDVLDHSGDRRISDIMAITPQKHLPSAQSRSYIIDVFAKTVDNEVAIYELTLAKQLIVVDRSFIYAEQALTKDAPTGTTWNDLAKVLPKRVIMLNILNFEHRMGDFDFHQIAEMTYRQPPRELASDRFITHNIELPKFRKVEVDFNVPLHCWLYMLCQAQDNGLTLEGVVAMEPRLTEFAKRPGVRQYMTQYAAATASPAVRDEYYTWVKDQMLLQEDLKLQKAEARNEGIEIGELRGLEQAAINAILEGFDDEIVARIGKISIDRAKELRQKEAQK